MKRAFFRAIAFAVLNTSVISGEVSAATLNPDGLGEALHFPYYTVRSASGNAFNTFNTSSVPTLFEQEQLLIRNAGDVVGHVLRK